MILSIGGNLPSFITHITFSYHKIRYAYGKVALPWSHMREWISSSIKQVKFYILRVSDNSYKLFL